MGIWDAARRAAGSVVSGIGTALGLPEWNISERIAGPVRAAERPPPPPPTGGGGSWGSPPKGDAPIRPPIGGGQGGGDGGGGGGGGDGGGTTPPPPGLSGGVWWSDSANMGEVNGQQFRDKNQWLASMPQGDRDAYEAQEAWNRQRSGEEAARQAAEAKMKRFNELVVPIQNDVETFLKGRRSLSDMFQEQLTQQDVPGQEALLRGYSADEAKLQSDLKTIPTEDIARRRETGMLSAAAERRVRSMEERPIREQLLGVSSAKESQRIGLERAYNLVSKWMDILQEQEKREVEPLERRLKFAGEEFEIEADNIAAQLTGFTNDRKDALIQLQDALTAKRQLTRDQAQELADLRKLEIEHAYTMQEQAARQRGEKPREFEVESQILSALRDDIVAGGTLQEVASDAIKQGIEPDVILNLWNLNRNREQVSPDQFRSEFGVTTTPKQIPSVDAGGGGSPI